ncbi:tetratricopeptide repeat protein [Streptomyces mirabilis]
MDRDGLRARPDHDWQQAVVQALCDSPVLGDRGARAMLAELIGDRLGRPVVLREQATTQLQHLRHRGNVEEALRLGTKICHRYEETYGKHHPHALSAAVNLAITYRLLGNAAAAQYIDAVALAQLTEGLGATHPSTLVCRTNLASDHYALGDAADALRLDTETLRGFREVFDTDHPSTLACAANLAMDLRAVGRVEEAEALHGDTHNRLLRMGSGHPAVAQAFD